MMTREEAIRTIGDVFAFAGFSGRLEGGPQGSSRIYTQALLALGVEMEEIVAVANRASAEYASERGGS